MAETHSEPRHPEALLGLVTILVASQNVQIGRRVRVGTAALGASAPRFEYHRLIGANHLKASTRIGYFLNYFVIAE